MNNAYPSIARLRHFAATSAHLLIYLFFLTVMFVTPSESFASDRHAKFTKVADVVSHWRADQHLYVKGNLGIGEQQLANLEQWLDANGAHWTVVLMQNSIGETYVAPDGRVFQGMDAVEYALGHGLGNRTPFGELEHPGSGETDGAVFVLFYEERKMSYYSSDAQDRRRLGQSHWINELDRPAFRAMRGGERIIDAAKSTVSTIQSRLDQRIAAEKANQQRQQRERARAVTQLRLEIERIRQDIAAISESKTRLLSAYPKAKGELADPPMETWKSELATIDDKLTSENVRTVSQELDAVSDKIASYQNGYAVSQTWDEEIRSLNARISQQGNGPNDVGAVYYGDARRELEAAQIARTQGELALGEHLASARQKVSEAQDAIAQETDRVARVAARNRAIRNTAIGTGSAASLGIAGFLIFMNRRRAPAKARALEAFGKRRTSVKDEMDNVLSLFTRSNEILGSKEKVERRGYTGDTDRLSDSTFESVDDLLIMSNEVERVMGEAEAMLEPSNPIDRVANVFSASNYEQAVNHISGQPLVFHRDRGLPAVFESDIKAQQAGDDPPESITMTFEKVFGAFRQRCNDANATLDQLEGCLLNTNDELAEFQSEIEDVTSTDRVLHETADGDGFFLVPNLFEVLLPSAHEDFDAADKISGTDPVQASRVPIPTGRRKMANAKQITKSIEFARRKLFPELKERREALEAKGYEIAWIENTVVRLGERANELLAMAAKRDITDEAADFHQDVVQLGETATQCVALAHEVEASLEPAAPKLTDAIEEGRGTVSKRLKLRSNDVLRENNYVPDDRLAFAKKQIESCRAAIHRGNASAATDAAASAKENFADGHAIVDDSIAALDDFEELLRKRQGRHTVVAERIPKQRSRLEESHKTLADSALIFKAGNPAFTDPHESVDHALADAEEYASITKTNLTEAKDLYTKGRVLHAVALLAEAEQHAAAAISRFEDIESHLTLAHNQLAANNREIDKSLGRAETLHRELRDPRITRPTLDRYERVAGEVESIRNGLSSGVAKRDPFAEARPMLELQERLDQLEAHLQGDKNAHEEATRAVRGAETQLVTARRLIETASSDGIPDSRTTTQCVREIRELDAALTVTAKRLDVAHDQWHEVDADAARIQSALGVSTARLQGELESAQRTVESFRMASQNVLQATRWAGPFGISIGGSPGAQELERARALLNSGDYSAVTRMVQAASMAAQSAIQQAEREVTRRRREKARQEEAARRRRMRSSGSGLGGFGSSGRSQSISRPSRSFGGSSRSSKSNTSGFSRSGW